VRIFAIMLVVLQAAVSLILVGWVLANAGLLQGPLLVVAIGLAAMTALAVIARKWFARRPPSPNPLTEEHP
jgi:hypothetical protein